MNSTAIIVPCFNESSRIGDGEYLLALSKRINADFYYVNDGSNDDTQTKLTLIAKKSKAKVVELKNNCGKGEAIRQGLREAIGRKDYEILGYLDADGAFPVTEVERSTRLAREILHQSPATDIYIASRIKLAGKDINRSSMRHYLSRLIITLIGFKTQNMPYDSQSGLKFFRNTEVLRVSLDKPFKTRWFFDLELMTRLGMQDRKCIWEEPVNSWSDIKGSKIRARTILSIAKEILVIRGLISRRQNL
jgi:glycosyltransferase involved in cell wall biosynthesis